MRTCLIFCLLALGLAAMPAAAQNESAKDAFRQTEKGFGRLLQGMGQEIRKAGDAVSGAAKKEDGKQSRDERKKEERK